MADKSGDGCAGIGCGCVVLLVAFSIVMHVIQAYFKVFTPGKATLGAFLGVLAGVGLGVLVPLVAKGHREKAKLGPLPWSAYFRSLAKVRQIYLGVEPPQPDASPVQAELVNPESPGAPPS